jgi:hypothetical protein
MQCAPPHLNILYPSSMFYPTAPSLHSQCADTVLATYLTLDSVMNWTISVASHNVLISLLSFMEHKCSLPCPQKTILNRISPLSFIEHKRSLLCTQKTILNLISPLSYGTEMFITVPTKVNFETY